MASMLRREKQKKKRNSATHAEKSSLGRKLISALLVVTLSTMSYSPAIAISAGSSSDAQSTMTAASNETTTANDASQTDNTEANAPADDTQSSDPADEGTGQNNPEQPAAPSEGDGSGRAEPSQGSESSASASASSASASSSGSSASSASAQAAKEKTIQGSVSSVAGGRYTVSIKYQDNAAIPDGAQVKITEYVQEPTDPENKREPLETEAFVSKEYLADRTAVLGKGIGVPKDGYIYFGKFLDVSIVHDGREVVPQAAVEVTFETTAVDITCADSIELANMVHDEAIAKDPQAVKDGFVAKDGKTAKAIKVDNVTFDKDPKTDRKAEDDGIVKLRYQTKEFGELAIAGAVVPAATVWQDGKAKAEVLGPIGMGVHAYETQAAGLEEGEELLGAYAFGTEPSRERGTRLWVRVTGETASQAPSAKAASGRIVGYALEGGVTVGGPVVLGTADKYLGFKASEGFALVREGSATAQAGKKDEQTALAGSPSVLEAKLPANNGGSYVVKLSYGPESGIPEGAKLQVRELTGAAYWEHRALTLETLDADWAFSVCALDIVIIDEAGNKVEPTGDVDVSITLSGAVVKGSPEIVHFGEEGAEVITPEQSVEAPGNGSIAGSRTLDFMTDEFSVYTIAYIDKAITLTASDGNTYRVAVTYNSLAGIPDNAELVVAEIVEGDEGYDDYIAKSIVAMGNRPDRFVGARAFDISLRNPDTGEEYEPHGNVEVSVELVGEDLEAYDGVGVIHFANDASDQPEVVASAVEGSSVEFSTDGFSVYVIAIDDPSAMPRRTYQFNIWSDANNRWDPYMFTTDTGVVTNSETVVNGETPVVPSPVATGSKQFAGWYAHKEGSTDFEDEPYNFSTPITQNEVVPLYALFKDYAQVIFHDQYNDQIGGFPIAAKRGAELTGNPQKATVKISDLSTTYSGDEEMKFYGWSYTPITVPGSATDDYGDPVSVIEPDANGCIEVSGETHLYPVYKNVKWLSYWSGPTGSGATYFPAQAYHDGVGPSSLPVPTWTGHTFEGWFIGEIDPVTEEVTYGSVAFCDSEGNLINGAHDGGASVYNGALHLTFDTTLYAKWSGTDSTTYKIIVWKQKTTADADTPAAYKYDFVESAVKTVPIGSTATIDAAYKNYATTKPAEFGNYTCRYDDDVTPVNPSGYTVLNVWYDRNGGYTPSGAAHVLSFVDSSNNSTVVNPATVPYETPLAGYVPADPKRDHYDFTGWFADANCTTQVFFTKEALDAYEGYNQTVLYDEMPDNDLTIYAGWSATWYVVQVDPNYGSFNGTGSTWFWKTIESDLVQEYTQVTRDYVESSSGEWYYVKKDRAYYGYSGNEWDKSEPDRDAHYTKVPGEATEYKTFEEAEGIYSYAGWYEVFSDGTEQPYDFNQHVDHDTLIRLHWKKAGVFYMKYVAGDGTMDTGGKDAADNNKYADNAEIPIAHSALPPEQSGYTFAGWRVQGDTSGKIYGLGESFNLQSDFAVSISGKETVTLEAVYVKLGTASLTYDFNGGTHTGDFDYGAPLVATTPPAQNVLVDGHPTVLNLINNSEFRLSSGTGLARANATFKGWSLNDVYNPAKDTLFDPSGVYGVNNEDPTTVYAVWQTTVNFHLNRTDASWSGQDTQNVYLGNAVAEPTSIPTCTTEGTMFRFWTTNPNPAAEDATPYDFSTSVTDKLDLYAYWAGPIEVPVHAVDASNKKIKDKTTAGGGWSATAANVGAAAVNLLPDGEHPGFATAPDGYELAFVAAHPRAATQNNPEDQPAADEANLQTITEDEAVTAIYYNQSAKHLYVKFADTSKADAALDETYDLYYVYYETKNLGISYKTMASSGALSAAAVEGTAPTTTDVKLGSYDMAAKLTRPLAWASSENYFAYAIGNAGAENASGLHLITTVSNSDANRPPLKVRNTWRGFQYTTETGDNPTWVDCGYLPNVELYVVYFAEQPTIVMFGEQTLGTSEALKTEFTFNLKITEAEVTTVSKQKQRKTGEGSWEDAGDPVVTKTSGPSTTIYDTTDPGNEPYKMKNGDAESAVLFYNRSSIDVQTSDEYTEDGVVYHDVTTTTVATEQTAEVKQTANNDFSTAINGAEQEPAVSYTYTYTADGTGGTQTATFTNADKQQPVEVHVARIENGKLELHDELRQYEASTYSFNLPITQSRDLLKTLPADGVYKDTTGLYAFGTILTGSTASETPGSVVSVDQMGVASIEYGQVEGNHYELLLEDGSEQSMGELGTLKLYYLYYPMPEIQYVKQTGQGEAAMLSAVRGSTDGTTPSATITYDGATTTMNGKTVTQDQRIEVPMDGLTISQQSGVSNFNMPPILDDEIYQRYLSYTSIGVGTKMSTGESESISVLNGNISNDLVMYLRIDDDQMSWSFDGSTWHPYDGDDAIYAIYTERGYDFQLSKIIDTSVLQNRTPGESDALFTDRSFTVTISSSAITKSSYKAEGAETVEVPATPATSTTPGTIVLTVRDGTKVKLQGLGRGGYTFTETQNENFELTAKSGPIVGEATKTETVSNNRTVSMPLNTETQLVMTNSPKAICKITVDGQDHLFYTLHDAIYYVVNHIPNLTATIEMLTDYLMPAEDVLAVPANADITLTTARSFSGRASINRSSGLADSPMITNNGSLRFEEITIDGKSVNATAPMIESAGTLTVEHGTTLQNAVNSGNGGAIYATGNVNLTGSYQVSLKNNQAANGGLLYYAGVGTVSVAGGDITGNSAVSATGEGGSLVPGCGGAIYAEAGTIDVTGGNVSNNNATNGNGGAIYSANAEVKVSGNASISSNSAALGGAVYVETGSYTQNGGTVSSNTASGVSGGTEGADVGKGGAVYIERGDATVSGGTLSGNKAQIGTAERSGLGGGLYVEAGSATITGSASTPSITSNEAANGAAVYDESGKVNFTGGSITGNTAADAGGAVGVGGTTARLNFSGTPSITGNSKNVYLDQDTDAVINTTGFSNGAHVGIYVPDTYDEHGVEYLFKNRGDVGARFGAFVNNSDNVSGFYNDRLPNIDPVKDQNTKKVYWSKQIQVQVRTVDNVSSSFEPGTSGTKIYPTNGNFAEYSPRSSNTAISIIGDDLYETIKGSVRTRTYAAAYLMDGNAGKYLVRIIWETDPADGQQKWIAYTLEGKEPLGDHNIVIYYTDATYLSIESNIENNAPTELDISTLTVAGQSVTAASPMPGLVFAKGGAIQSELVPVTEDDLKLAANGGSVNILLPGGQNKAYDLEGSFDKALTDVVRLRYGGVEHGQISIGQQTVAFGGTTDGVGKTYEIIFGEDKVICKIVTEQYGTARFPTLAAAVAYAREKEIHDPTIEMLVDYLIPQNDVLKVVPTDGITSLTLTTAAEYGTGHATLSRGSGNTKDPLMNIAAADGSIGMTLNIHDLDFDGKSLQGECDGGALKSKNCKVEITDVACKNFIANNGGAMFVSFGRERAINNNAREYRFDEFPSQLPEGYYSKNATLTMTNVDFKGCESRTNNSRSGGGAVWTNAATLTMTDCDFDTCKATRSDQNQGGAVFHRIDGPTQGNYYHQPYNPESRTVVNNCTFTSCTSKAGGGMETDAHHVEFYGCEFTGCTTEMKDGGAVNIYIFEQNYNWTTYETDVHMEGCRFVSCTAWRNGGAVRSLAVDTTFVDCEFLNTTASCQNSGAGGGAIAVTNTSGISLTIQGGSFAGCVASNGTGGAIYSMAKELTVKASTSGGKTSISNCQAQGSKGNGGAVWQNNGNNGSFAHISDCTIDGCLAAQNGGAIYPVNLKEVTFTDSKIRNCTATAGNGGGICHDLSTPLTLIRTDVTGNKTGSANGKGAGVYCKNDLTLQDAHITGNQLQAGNDGAENAAGVYLVNEGATLKIGDKNITGDAALTAVDTTVIMGNTTRNGANSNMRLPERNGANKNCVTVYYNLVPSSADGYIGVVNAKKVGTQFGLAKIANPTGFSDSDSVFKADASTLHGIIDRTDASGTKIIWAGPPVCKITDADGRLLYFKSNGTDPAIFDVLEDGNENRTSAFGTLRNLNPTGKKYRLYYAPLEEGGVGEEYTGSVHAVKMLVEQYELTKTMTTVVSADRTIILTTASKSDTDKYPFDPEASGNRATITRGAGVTGSMAWVRVNMELSNIVLDGANVDSTDNGAIVRTGGDKKITVSLLSDAILQYGKAQNGGAVAVVNSNFEVNGGLIRFCEATANGGGVYIAQTSNIDPAKGFVLAAGDIQQCKAVDGGGVYVYHGAFNMSDGLISGCMASGSGGGVFVRDGETMNMSGGAIGKSAANTAGVKGGGIAVGGANAKLNFSRQVNISNNTRTGSEAVGGICNVELDQDTKAVINTSGLYNRSYIGVYVPGHRDDAHPENDGMPYKTRGGEGDAFGSFTAGKSQLYCFVNDRNGLKGGLIAETDPAFEENTVYWIKIFSIELHKEVQTSDNVPEQTKSKARTQSFTYTVRLWNDSGNVSGITVADIAAEIAAAREAGEESKFGSIPFAITDDPNVIEAEVSIADGEMVSAENLPDGLGYDVTEHWTEGYCHVPADLNTTINYMTGKTGENKTRTDVNPYVSDLRYRNIQAVCKIVDENGNLLYRNQYRPQGKPIDQAPAVYTDLSEAYRAINLSTPLYANKSDRSHSGGYHIEMLVPEYYATSTWNLTSSKPVTLTTAAASATDNFPFDGTGTAAIKRATSFVDGSMVRLTSGSDLMLVNVRLDGNKVLADTEGGIAYVPMGAKLKVMSGAALQNSRTTGDGAGVYLAPGGMLRLSGGPVFGGTDAHPNGYIYNETGNFKVGDLKDADGNWLKNGGSDYKVAHQDIFLAESNENNPQTLFVDGSLSGEAGSIWVWATSEYHYRQLMPFATAANGAKADFAVFRNARPDDVTENATGKYLYGVQGTGNFIAWSGGARKVILQKVSASQGYDSLSGAVFDLYRGTSTTPYIEGITSMANGSIYVGELPYGTYYLQESYPANRRFELTVPRDGDVTIRSV